MVLQRELRRCPRLDEKAVRVHRRENDATLEIWLTGFDLGDPSC